MTNIITLIRPDDWHLHLRDGASMRSVVAASAAEFSRAIIMPNLSPPVTTTTAAEAYHSRILDALPEGVHFTPLMTLYLTDNTTAEEIERASVSSHIVAAKLYPAGATTNSDSGVTDIENILEPLQAMANAGMPLLVHGEVTDPAIDLFDREAVFIEQVLAPLIEQIPSLKVVFEHITTEQGVRFVQQAPSTVAATITAHHLLMNRNAMFQGGMRPHYYCLPVLKREQHRLALVEAATSGSPKFFLGTDSAPHPQHAKESSCGCAGMYTAHRAMALYAEVFDKVDALDKLEGFASLHGPDFYNLPRNRGTLTLVREEWNVPQQLPFGTEFVVPFRAGESVHWSRRE